MFDLFYPLLKILFPELTWSRKVTDKKLFLTFDDGPIPGLTEFILDELKKMEMKATFFCVGDNIRKHPEILQRIVTEGHKVGNHTFNHLKGWKTSTVNYLNNVDRWEECYSMHCIADANRSAEVNKRLFRPPYGRVTRTQLKALKKDYEIIMWNLLTLDYSASQSGTQVLNRAIKGTKPGAIVVFHDNMKASSNVHYALPKYLEHLKKEGYETGLL